MNACFAAAMANKREWGEKKTAFLEYRQRLEGEMPGLCDGLLYPYELQINTEISVC